jgi:hypothetical protein
MLVWAMTELSGPPKIAYVVGGGRFRGRPSQLIGMTGILLGDVQ